MTSPRIEIQNLHASINDKPVLKGVNLVINPGETHAIMGPNGSGKSSLSHVIAGNPNCTITSGDILFDGKPLSDMNAEERAQAGIFLSFQYPVELPGVNNTYFLRQALNNIRKTRGEDPIDAFDFMQLIRTKSQLVGMPETFLKRAVNEGFSGGEKKRNEILQLLVLEPKLAILDEIDSGLDIDALQMIAQAINHSKTDDRSLLLVTHYQRLLDYIKPDYVHVLANGKIIKTGDAELALTLESKGYGWLTETTEDASS